jgi:hypothetical protein
VVAFRKTQAMTGLFDGLAEKPEVCTMVAHPVLPIPSGARLRNTGDGSILRQGGEATGGPLRQGVEGVWA